MAEDKQFGTRLRELRVQAHLTQRELAEKIGVDFSYLSKMENGVLPPPSEKVLLKLAEALGADEDELFALAGKIPNDIAQLLKHREALQFLRSGHARKKVLAKKGEGTSVMKEFKKLPKLVRTYKSFARVAVAALLVVAVGTSLWFAAPLPVKALDISYPSLPSSGTLGSQYTFTLTVDIASTDLLPVDHIDLEIYNASNPSSYKVTLANLPLADSALSAHTITEGSSSGTAQVSASATAWGYGTGSRTGYGYRDPEGWGYHTISGTTGGYGYGTSPFTGVTASITYTVKWTPPSGWPSGSYRVKAYVYADSTDKFSGTSSSFSLAAAAPTSTTEPPAPAPEPVVAPLADVVDPSGVFTETFTHESADGKVEINIDDGTTGTTATGEPLSEITITRVADPPDPPASAESIGLTYDLGPTGATFDPPLTLTFTYSAARIPSGTSPESLTIAYYDEDTGTWIELGAEDITVDPVTNTITARVSHFTYFTVIAFTEPAVFEVSSLNISPTEVDIAKGVNISINVANVGDLSDSHEVVLTIDGVITAVKRVTVAGHTVETVTFTVIKGAAGDYSVMVNGLAGAFTVRPVATLAPAPPAPKQTIVVSPLPTVPSASSAPPAPPVTPAPMPTPVWLLVIIGLVTAGIVGFVLWFFAFRREY